MRLKLLPTLGKKALETWGKKRGVARRLRAAKRPLFSTYSILLLCTIAEVLIPTNWLDVRTDRRAAVRRCAVAAAAPSRARAAPCAICRTGRAARYRLAVAHVVLCLVVCFSR